MYHSQNILGKNFQNTVKQKKSNGKKKKKAMMSKQIGKHSFGRRRKSRAKIKNEEQRAYKMEINPDLTLPTIDRYLKSRYILFIRQILMQNDKKIIIENGGKGVGNMPRKCYQKENYYVYTISK